MVDRTKLLRERPDLPVDRLPAFKRMEALQQRLNTADQRMDELISAVRSINRGKRHEVFVPGDDEPQYRQRKEWVDWILNLCGEAPASLEQPAAPVPAASASGASRSSQSTKEP